MPTLHVVIPFYNEPDTLDQCLRRMLAAPLPDGWRLDATLVNDGSTPDAARAARATCATNGVRFLEHDRNRGKGAAIRTGFHDALSRADDSDAVIVQDADLEYDPNDFAALLAALRRPEVDAVFGNRWAGTSVTGGDAKVHRRLHRAMNRALTLASNALSGLRVNDMECCYKLFRAPTLRRILPSLTEDRFGIEPEMAAALGRLRARVEECPVRYAPRSFAEGKKIRPRDGFRALWVIARERRRRGGTAP